MGILMQKSFIKQQHDLSPLAISCQQRPNAGSLGSAIVLVTTARVISKIIQTITVRFLTGLFPSTFCLNKHVHSEKTPAGFSVLTINPSKPHKMFGHLTEGCIGTIEMTIQLSPAVLFSGSSNVVASAVVLMENVTEEEQTQRQTP